MITSRIIVRALLASALCGGAAFAQANTDPGIDIQLAQLSGITVQGREGTFPDGNNAVSISTTICNVGIEEVPWFQAMNPDHPFISFVFARESDGRLQQISDRSWVKHGFFALTSSFCDPCNPPSGQPGTMLGVGCSDTYSSSNNGDNFWLGDPDEILPFDGIWEPIGSQFDRGEPPVDPPFDTDGLRSLTINQSQNLGPIGHRVQISDGELNAAGTFYYQGYYIVMREGEALRADNLATRSFSPSWNGTKWTLSASGTLTPGSILSRWSGATVTSAANGSADGRVYVATLVSGPVNGLYHYEYAIHNRDNSRGVGDVKIPFCSGGRVLDAGFHDIDDDPSNDWQLVLSPLGDEISFTNAGTNPIRWNSFFNVWFDSDVAPVTNGTNGALTIEAFDAGPGAASFPISATVPGELFNVYLGAGCSTDGTPPTLFATGTPARATIGNGSFGLATGGNVASQLNVLLVGFTSGALTLNPACTLWLGGAPGVDFVVVGSTVADAQGVATYATPIPNDAGLEGLSAFAQCVGVNPAGGAFLARIELSDALEARIGDNIASCP